MALIVMIKSEALRSGVLYLLKKKSHTDLQVILFRRGHGMEITEEWILYICILYENCSIGLHVLMLNMEKQQKKTNNRSGIYWNVG